MTDKGRGDKGTYQPNYKEIQEGIAALWKEEPLSFGLWELLNDDEVDDIVKKFSNSFDKKPGFLEDEASKDKELGQTKKSLTVRNVDPTDWAKMLDLKSADNSKAQCLQDYLVIHLNKSLEWVSSFTILW